MRRCVVFFFQAEDGIRDLVRSRGLGDVYKRQVNADESDQRAAFVPPRAGDQQLKCTRHRAPQSCLTERQIAHAFAGGLEDRIGDRGADRRHRAFADAGRRDGRRQHVRQARLLVRHVVDVEEQGAGDVFRQIFGLGVEARRRQMPATVQHEQVGARPMIGEPIGPDGPVSGGLRQTIPHPMRMPGSNWVSRWMLRYCLFLVLYAHTRD